MAIMNFGGVDENVVTREEFPLEKAREILKDETIAVIGAAGGADGVCKEGQRILHRHGQD